MIKKDGRVKVRIVAGCMTGTSIDGLDAALVQIEGNGLTMKVKVLRALSRSFGELAKPLRRLSQQQPMTAGQIVRAAHDLSDLHLYTLRELIGNQTPDLVAVHGQTVFHKPPLSWQLINPAPIAYGLNVPVVYDLRSADLAAGGEGAPITPIADFILFRSSTESRSIVNLGGFCNVTILPPSSPVEQRANAEITSPPGQRGGSGNNIPENFTILSQIIGKDVCVCNQLLDLIANKLFHRSYDSGGFQAAHGSVKSDPFERLTMLLSEQADSKRSLGTDDVLENWLDKCSGHHIAQDIARTACAAIAETIVKNSLPTDRLILAGGGTANKTLVREIRDRCEQPVELSDKFGVPFKYREAAAIAVLGALCQDNVPITLPQVTGVLEAPLSGCWILSMDLV